MAADGDVGEKSTFRCIDAARYVLAFAVTVLIVTVIAHAIVVVLRPESLTLRVVGGYVSVKQSQSLPPDHLEFFFTLQAVNPSGRVRIYYTNIKCRLRGKINSTSPAKDFLRFPVPADMTVVQRRTLDSNCQPDGDLSPPYLEPYFDRLHNGSSIPDAMLQLNGTLFVEINSRYNKTGRQVFYYCSPLTVGGEDMAGADVTCTDTKPASIS